MTMASAETLILEMLTSSSKKRRKKKNVLAVGVKKRKVGFKENCPGLRGQFLPPNRKGKSLYRH